MKSTKLVAVAVMVLAGGGICTSVYAQEQAALTGKYSGTYTTKGSRGERQWGLELNITSVENTKVKGTLLRYGAACKGDFELEGTIKENQLVLRSNKGGAAEDCTSNFRLVVEGTKLVGTMGSFPAQFSK